MSNNTFATKASCPGRQTKEEKKEATCKGQGQKETIEASGNASRQAQQAVHEVGQDGSGGSGVGAVIGLSATAGEGGTGDPGGAGGANQVSQIRNEDGKEMGDGVATQSSATGVYHLSQMVHPHVWTSFFSSLVGLPGHDAWVAKVLLDMWTSLSSWSYKLVVSCESMFPSMYSTNNKDLPKFLRVVSPGHLEPYSNKLQQHAYKESLSIPISYMNLSYSLHPQHTDHQVNMKLDTYFLYSIAPSSNKLLS
nr:hypothetical protein [Tanacetum cinerariifolium]